ncbi:MAG: hypothetical protein U9R51_06790, partial [Actinomycetota bacterium]|nr:hypothetical protein [Actinomycetota bacterium]
AMSRGGSGSHYLGKLLHGAEDFHLTEEVYFPPTLLDTLAASNELDGSPFLDFIDLLHTGRIDAGISHTTVVNIGHLNPHARPVRLRNLGVRGHFLLLLRNPFDLTVSRAFRKEQYRAASGAITDDDEYLSQQARSCAGFLRRATTQQWDMVVRYEHLVDNPISVLRDIFLSLGTQLDIDGVNDAIRRNDANRAQERANMGNLNLEPRKPLAPRHARILMTHLLEPAAEFGYMAPLSVSDALGYDSDGSTS